MKKMVCVFGMMLATLGASWSAQAIVITVPQSSLIPSTMYYTDIIGGGLGSQIMAPNDDNSSSIQSLGFTLPFYGNNYKNFYINNNGSITFTYPKSGFTPGGLQGASMPIFSPFFADVDTRSNGSVYLRSNIANEIIVTWDQVGYFSKHIGQLNSFQLVLRGPDYSIPVGEGAIGFFYKTMQWETGDASGGSQGFGGAPAAVGFGDGISNGEIIQGTTQNGIASVLNNEYIWFDQKLAPIPTNNPVPEPGTMMLLGLGMAGLAVYGKRRHNKIT